MKKRLNIWFVLFAIVLMTLSACGGGDNGPTALPEVTSQDYDWAVQFIWDMDLAEKTSTYSISVYNLTADFTYNPSDVYGIDVGEHQTNLWHDETNHYEGTINLDPGREYHVNFTKNGEIISSSKIRMPYKATVAFPLTFFPSLSATMNWSMQHNNSYQIAEAYSINQDTEQYDYYMKILSPSARTFTFPANAVESMNPSSYYVLYLTQENFSKNGRVAFSSYFSTAWAYPGSKHVLSREEQIRISRARLNLL